jgi:cytochrome oxidase Cu insertion factor (SCO1/SenC/PrrC family)
MSRLLTFSMVACLGTATLVAQGQAPAPATAPAQPPATAPQYSADLKVGDMAPAFTLPGSDGKTHTLSEYKGKTVVLAWFPKAFTGG